ncbi:MAG: Tyrosine-protein kinase YwqD [Verrucomicrobia bacterium ADurb.Bin345]|nr:MAG: Tyrosine-protein kinase YwqD [Verrucomicrobia bacterium ADurb.Bin345]
MLSRGNAECPGYLWESRGMQAVLSDLRQRFDRIVLHTSPVRISGDAINAARYADGVVIVVRADETRREVVNRALDVLRSAKGRILGAVLTDRKQTIPGMVYRRI